MCHGLTFHLFRTEIIIVTRTINGEALIQSAKIQVTITTTTTISTTITRATSANILILI